MEFVPVSGCVLISCLCENSSVQYIYLRFFVAANEEFVCVCVLFSLEKVGFRVLLFPPVTCTWVVWNVRVM